MNTAASVNVWINDYSKNTEIGLFKLVSFSINNRLYCNIIIEVFFYDRMIVLHTVKDL